MVFHDLSLVNVVKCGHELAYLPTRNTITKESGVDRTTQKLSLRKM